MYLRHKSIEDFSGFLNVLQRDSEDEYDADDEGIKFIFRIILRGKKSSTLEI